MEYQANMLTRSLTSSHSLMECIIAYHLGLSKLQEKLCTVTFLSTENQFRYCQMALHAIDDQGAAPDLSSSTFLQRWQPGGANCAVPVDEKGSVDFFLCRCRNRHQFPSDCDDEVQFFFHLGSYLVTLTNKHRKEDSESLFHLPRIAFSLSGWGLHESISKECKWDGYI